MEDFEITNSNNEKCSFAEVIGTTPVIVSHAVDPLTELEYYRYLDSLNQRVVLIISKENPLIPIMVMTHNLKIETYTDHDQNFLRHLRQKWSLEPDTADLVRQLRCQILYDKGNETKSWKQPVSEQWKNFLEDRSAFKKFHKHFGSWGVKWLRKQDKDNHGLWSLPNQSAYGKQIYGDTDIVLFMKFYILLPNKELESELEQLS